MNFYENDEAADGALDSEGMVIGTAAGASIAQGDATHLDFDDETFDAVTSNYVYHNIPSRDRQAILLETLRIVLHME